MTENPADSRVIEWARQRAAPHYYTDEANLPTPCLKVQCGHVTAYFCQGRLTRLWAHADSDLLDEMFAELTQLFSLYPRPLRKAIAQP